MIKTDGVGSSVLLVKLINEKPVEITSKMQKELKEKLESRDKYIEDIKNSFRFYFFNCFIIIFFFLLILSCNLLYFLFLDSNLL